ncbi:amidase [Jeotgalibacillus sp. JSM ZJ347]|uniref:amidase n=1 Tax=Jeotgalibacillus sp. JSM ZJ347 TaxID=3342117 RepID=UPI0035A92FC7
MNKKEYAKLDATEMAALIKSNKVTSKEMVETAFAIIDSENPRVNAVTHLRYEEAMAEAEKADLSAPFGGVPILLKDMSQNVKGSPATAGARLLKENRAIRNSHFVDQLIQAGFIVLGHTNAPEFGLKNITEPKLHGPSRNPLSPSHSPGGSSGGAAAAVGSGMVPVAGASDGGGSIRIPSSFSGLIGLKPTRGRMPVGPGAGRQWQGAAIDFFLTKSVRDTAGLLDCMQVYQKEAAFHTPLYPSKYTNAVTLKHNYKIAYSIHSPVGTPVSKEAEKAVLKTVNMLKEAGFHCEEAAPPINGKELMQQYYMMNCGEMAGLVHNLEQVLNRKLKIDDVEIESWALYQAGLKCSAGDFSRSLAAWDQAAALMNEFHQQYDLFVTPAAAHTAPLIGQLEHSESMMKALSEIHSLPAQEQQELIYQMFEPSLTLTPYTQLANLTGQPAVSLPLYTAESGLPLGVQVMAPKGNEHWLLNISHILMNEN